MSVLDAYQNLLDIASRGREYVDGEVFTPAAADGDPRMSQVVGNGFDFERTVLIDDADEANEQVEGVFKLRVLRLTRNGETTLFLRSNVTWETATGGTHVSHAAYDLTAAAAEELANKQPAEVDETDYDSMPEEELLNTAMPLLFDTFAEEQRMRSYWKQTVPSRGEELYTADLTEEEYFDAVRAENEAGLYHQEAILGLMEREPQLACMLSDIDFGEVGAGEIELLLAWVSDQPEVSAVV